MTVSAVPAAPATQPVVEAAGIRKRFGSTQALRGVDLALQQGRCLGLVGRNGAGKSTLVSVLSGIYAADSGSVSFAGAPAPALGDAGAWRSRIATVHQHSMVVPALTVAENVFLGSQPGRGGLVDWGQMNDRARQLMREWGFPIDVRQPCARLTVEQRQIVEIARAIAAGTRCLLLDEPTAALERDAIARLFQRVRQLVAGGVAVLYISHHLEEVFEICQDVAVIRDGEIVLTAPTATVTKEQLVAAMVGTARPDAEPGGTAEPGEAAFWPGTAAARPGEPAARPGVAAGRPGGTAASPGGRPRLTVDRLSAASPRGALRGVSLEVGPGERVGVTGLLSAGVATLARVVAGAEPCDGGRVLIDGQPVTPGRPDLALLAGVGYIPEDRQAEGYVPLLSVAENATMTIVDRLAARTGWLRPQARARAATPLARRLSVVSAGLGQPVAELSGGNQQKVTVARALVRQPRLIVAVTPTRGVDVAAKALLLAELAEVTAESGAGLLLATDELSDLVICDRVIGLHRGAVFAEFTEPPFDREQLIAATEGLTALPGGRPGPE